MRIQKGAVPLIMSFGVMAAATAILWRMQLAATSTHHLVYLYLLPVALIAVLYTGRLALLCAAAAMVFADYFLQAPIYSLANDNPLEWGDLICFAILAVIAIKCIRVLMRPQAKILTARSRYGRI